jgi:Inhibitor of vertebrate lysozyme (Ivy)
MNRGRSLSLVVVLVTAALGVSSAARAQGKLDPDSLKLYGGLYAVNCAVATSPRLLVVADSLTVINGKKRLVGANPQASYSYFGQSPPPDYQVAFLGDLPLGEQLIAIVFKDAKGLFVQIDPGAKNRGVLGKALVNKPFRSCAPARPPEPAPVPKAANGEETQSAWNFLDDPTFLPLFRKALGPAGKDEWLVGITGPATPNEKVKIGGTDYVLGKWCKAHDCQDNTVVLLWSAEKKLVYGKIVRAGKSRLIGAPPPDVAAELERLWTKAWAGH